MNYIIKLIALTFCLSHVAMADYDVGLYFNESTLEANATLHEYNPGSTKVLIGKTLIFPQKVVALVKDENNVWLATRNSGIYVYSISNLLNWLRQGYDGYPEVKAIFTDKDWNAGHGFTSNATINSMEQDRLGKIWIGLEAGRFAGVGGLVRFTPDAMDSSQGTFRLFTKEDGLPSNRIRKIEKTEKGILLHTANGAAEIEITFAELRFLSRAAKPVPNRDQIVWSALTSLGTYSAAVVAAPVISVAATTYLGHKIAPVTSVRGVALLPFSAATGLLLTLSVWGSIATSALV